MRRIASFFFLVFLALGAAAQNISVKSFQALPMDMTASSLEGKRVDQNGATAALIKVVTSQTGFAFDGGTLGIVDTKQMVGEIWVWVPYGSRKITITHQQLGVLREYRYPIEIQSERTYEMVLTTAKVETIITEEVREQYLVFQIAPPNAVLEVNDQVWPVSAEGIASRLMSFGTYNYRVQASNYHPEAGVVTLDDPDNTKKIIVKLNPNFGWVEVTGTDNLRGASVYVDNALIGQAPCKSGPLKSGKYNVKIVKELYESYSTSVTVNDNETTTIAPNLVANFARITLKVDADAEIWVNNEKKGVRSWTGNLLAGVYRIETKMPSHESVILTKEIENQMDGEVIQLDTPRPIYGSLVVESTPEMASITIDGKAMGETPKLIKEILIGQHTVIFTKEGYETKSETVTVTKGERAQLKASLDKAPEKPTPPVDNYANNSNDKSSSAEPKEDVAIVLLQKVNAALASGNGIAVIDDLKTLSNLDRNNPSILFCLGTLYGDPKNSIYNPATAIDYYKQALRINADHCDSNYNLGALYISLSNERMDEANAITGFSKAEIERYNSLINLSKSYLSEGLPYLEKSYQLQPSEEVKAILNAMYKRLNLQKRL